MNTTSYSLPYPRKRLARFFIRAFFKLILRILFRIDIKGKENFPSKGPLLVVGNHTGAMEVVLLNSFSPWQMEMLSAADMPAEKITEKINSLYGSIPLHRGSYDRAALSKALDVLKQDGFIGIFPEGGIWEESRQKALPGISWMSYRSGAPILPIGFNNTVGAMSAGLKFKRPLLMMNVGQVLPAAEIPEGLAKKIYFQEHATHIMDAVYSLVPSEEIAPDPEIINERFEMEINLIDSAGHTLVIPPKLQFKHPTQLAKLLHRPAVLDIFLVNLQLPVTPLLSLMKKPALNDLIIALESILLYLEKENPYLLTYRFGVREGLEMQEGLKELLKILEWCSRNNHQIAAIPVRRYYSPSEDREIIQREQEIYQPWM